MYKFLRIKTTAEKEAEKRAQEQQEHVQRERVAARAVGINPDSITTLSHSDEITALTVLPNGYLVSSGGGPIHIWNLETKRCEMTLNEYGVRAFAVLPNGNLVSGIAVTQFSSGISVWGNEQGKMLLPYPLLSRYSPPPISLDIFLNDAQKSIRMILSAHRIQSLAVLTDGSLVSLSFLLCVWDIEKRETIKTYITNCSRLAALPHGRLVSAGYSKIYIWEDIKKEKYTTIAIKGHNEDDEYINNHLSALVVLPDGRVAGGYERGEIFVWNMKTKRCEATLLYNSKDEYDSLLTLAALLDGRLASGGSCENTIRIWNIKTKQCEAILFGHTSGINTLIVLPNGHLISGSADHTIRIWDVGSPLTVESQVKKQLSGESTTHLYSSNRKRSATLKAPDTFNTLFRTYDEPVYPKSTFPIENQSAPIISRRNSNDMQSALAPHSMQSTQELEQQLIVVQQRLIDMQMQNGTFTMKEAHLLQARIIADQNTEILLLERLTIQKNKTYEMYYCTIQTHLSALMVAALGIGSGYVDVNNSSGAIVLGWACEALSSVFSGASMFTAAINAGVYYLDAQYRQALLTKIRLFGTTMTEVEILGEQVARLLLRAHFHAKNFLTKTQADKDAEALIKAIIKACPPLERNEHTAENLLKAIWKNRPYCIEPLQPYSRFSFSAPPPPSKTAPFMSSGILPIAPAISPATSVVTSPPSDIKEWRQLLEQERMDRRRLEEQLSLQQKKILEMETLLGEIVRKKSVPSEKINDGPFVKITREKNQYFSVDTGKNIERRVTTFESHLEEITQETCDIREDINELKECLIAEKVLSKESMFSSSLMASRNNTAQRINDNDTQSLKKELFSSNNTFGKFR